MATPWQRELMDLARNKYGSDDVEIAEEIADPVDFNTSEGDDGAWVLAWVFVRYPEGKGPGGSEEEEEG